jgi:hypothetical protein
MRRPKFFGLLRPVFHENAMKKSPLTLVKERFGEDRKAAKQKLVAAVRELAGQDGLLDRSLEDLEQVSNKKLLRLESVLKTVKEHGGRASLVNKILEAEKRTKDEGYKSRLERFPTPRLLDHYRSAVKRAG